MNPAVQQRPITCMDRARGVMMRMNPFTWFAKKSDTPATEAAQAQPHVIQPAPPSSVQIQPAIDSIPI